jgi:hypothetical protein
MEKTITVSSKGFSKNPFKLTQSENRQINVFLKYQASLLSSLGCPVNAITAYTETLGVRIKSERAGFLKKLSSLFIQGVKILGNDTPTFVGWRLKGRFPRLYHWVFTELSKYTENNCSVKGDVDRIRGLLSVLYGARSLKIQHGVAALKKAARDFFARTSKEVPETSTYNDYTGILERLKNKFGSIPNESRFPYGAQFSLEKRSQKPNKLWKNREHMVPVSVFRAANNVTSFDEGAALCDNFEFHDNAFVSEGPIGSVHVLSEKAGKTRVICGYNGFVNASDLYDRCRLFLDNIQEDASNDQSLGHNHAQVLSAFTCFNKSKPIRVRKLLSERSMNWASRPPTKVSNSIFSSFMPSKEKTIVPSTETSYEVLCQSGNKILSADLTAFTDNISKGSWEAILCFLRVENLSGILFSEQVVLPSGEAFTPTSVLMGMKGCFDMASMIHHALIPKDANYRIVGDDFVGVIPPEEYEKLVGAAGLTLNRSKTVYSSDTSVFCGKVFKSGIDVSPYVPPITTFFSDSASKAVDAAKEALERGFLFPCQFNELVRMVKTIVLPKLVGIRVSFELPTVLGGFNTRYGPNRGLLSVLEEKWQYVIASNSVSTIKPRQETRSRNPLPGFPMKGKKVLPWTNLYTEGGSLLPKRTKSIPQGSRKGPLFRLDEILSYMYGIKPHTD